MKIKICGICRPEDATIALEEGADLLGFIFARGPRQANPAVVAEIVKKLPPDIDAVGVFMNQTAKEVGAILDKTGLKIAQLHGSESPEYAASLGVRIIKTFTTFTKQSFNQLGAYDSHAFLLDLPKDSATRTTIDTDWATSAKKFGRIIAAGKLTPGTVGDVIRRIRPYGVDVCSWTERSPGVKDPERIREFIKAVRTAHRETQVIKVEVR